MSTVRRRIAGVSGLALAVTGVTVFPGLLSPAQAAPDGSGLVISEVYGAGGNNGAVYDADFVELYNPTSQPLELSGLAVHYRSAGGGSGGEPFALTGTVPPQGHFLVQMSAAGTNGVALPSPDAVASPPFNMAAAGGQVALQAGSTIIATTGDTAGVDGIVDFVGATSGAASYEGQPTPSGASAAQSLNRAAGADTDTNAADFTLAAPTPTNAAGETEGPEEPPTEPEEPPADPVDKTIAEVQGTGDASPLVGTNVTVEGVVTADYATGGLDGFYVQDPAGQPGDSSSDAVFVYGASAAAGVDIGDSVSVTGIVSEYQTLTEITPGTGGVTELTEPLGEVEPLAVPWEQLDSAAEKEAHEGELVSPTGPFTVTDNYDANYYGSFGLAAGTTPLVTPTEVADAQDEQAIAAVEAENAARRITLDDASSTNFNSNSNKATPLSYLTPENPVRVGSQATFHQPVVLDYRYGAWAFQPTAPISGDGTDVVTFSDTRAANRAPRDVGGDARLATFNVLNYFPTTGAEIESGGGECTFYTDRTGDPVTVNSCTTAGGGDGPRGAAEAEDLERQETKIVHAINGLDASIVSLEELENSIKFGEDRDFAIRTLVDALNEDAGAGTWAYVPSPAAEDLPALDAQDVIRTGFIYKPADIDLVGTSRVLVGSPAFGNARQPLLQAFKAAGAPDDEAFLVSVNHFKSKGSGVDDGTGQGDANPDRIVQAEALVDFADEVADEVGTEKVFLAGDFNSYSMEDPVQVIEQAGYTNLNHELNDGEASYNYDGMDGSLDHVFASPEALDMVTGVDVWQINAQEQVAFEYSRYNYNATLLYDDSVFRASDHNPEIVGLDLDGERAAASVSVKAPTIAYGKAGRVRVSVESDPVATGEVQVSRDGEVLGTAMLAKGVATVSLPAGALRPGTHSLTASYAGDGAVASASSTFSVRVNKSAARIAVGVPDSVPVGKRPWVSVTVTDAMGKKVFGQVKVKRWGKVWTKPTRGGSVGFSLKSYASPGAKPVRVVFTGSGNTGWTKKDVWLSVG